MRRRFFVKEFAGGRAVMEGETAHHLGRVLRAEAGQLYELSDGQRVWLARVEHTTRARVEFALVEEIPACHPSVDVTLLLSIVKFDAFEWALEKATELGVATIVPLAAARSERALVTAAPKRAERWRKILLEASQQSRRLRPPTLSEITRPKQAFAAVGSDATKVLLSEKQGAPSLRHVLSAAAPSTTMALAIGPEGGWTEEEFAAARAVGFQEASLGKLILRAETAVIAALASLSYALSD